MNMFFVTSVQYIYILAMVYITTDRFFRVLSPFKYHAWWNFRKAWKLIAVTWVVCILFGVGMSVFTTFHYTYVRYEARISRLMAVYVLTTMYAASMLISLVAYVYIFTQFGKSLRNRSLNHKSDKEESTKLNQTHENTHKNWYSKKLMSLSNYASWVRLTFKSSKFHIPFLLILTYLIMTVVPSVARSLHFLLGHRLSYEWTFFYLCSVRLSYTVDGVIYVLLQRRVRRLLWSVVTGSRAESSHMVKNPTTEC